MVHFDVPEVLIGVGILSFVWLALHNFAIRHYHHGHGRRVLH